MKILAKSKSAVVLAVFLGASCLPHSACSGKSPANAESTPPGEAALSTASRALKNQIRRLLRGQSHNEQVLLSEVAGKTWKELKPVIAAEAEQLEKEYGTGPTDASMRKLVIAVETAFAEHEIREAKAQQDRALGEIKQNLESMAEGNGLR